MTPTRVLHVDDEPDIRSIVELALGPDGSFAVQTCGSGEDALEVASKWSPDIILLDVMMPVMDGLTTFARLREDSRVASIPVVFMTARARPGDVEKFRSLGATGVIAKPFDPLTLGDSVRRHLRSRASVLAELRASFVARARTDAAALLVRKHDKSMAALGRIREIAHGLAGTAAIYGFERIGLKAAELEDGVATTLAGEAVSKDVEYSIDSLVASIACMGGDQVQH